MQIRNVEREALLIYNTYTYYIVQHISETHKYGFYA